MGERELLNVTSSLMPPGAEMPSMFWAFTVTAAGQMDVYWQVFSFLLPLYLLAKPFFQKESRKKRWVLLSETLAFR